MRPVITLLFMVRFKHLCDTNKCHFKMKCSMPISCCYLQGQGHKATFKLIFIKPITKFLKLGF